MDKDLFFDPLYESILIEQSLMMTRKKKTKEDTTDGASNFKIFGCATMWHETREEMKLLLQSALLMDKHADKS